MSNKTKAKAILPVLVVSETLAVDTALASDERRAELRQQLEAGQLNRIEFDARTFRTGRNRNHLRFYDQDIPALAASYAGVPFLRDHDVQHIESRDGTILTSALVGDAFHQRIALTTERGMKAFAEGQIDRFSIGWYYDDVDCGICKSSWLRSNCPHWPGRQYTVNNQVQTCELFFVNPKGKETSAVNAPAVDGTSILAQLSSYKESLMFKDQENTGQEAAAVTTAPAQELSAVQTNAVAWLSELRQQTVDNALANSRLSVEGQAAVRLAIGEGQVSPDRLNALITAQRNVEAKLNEGKVVQGVQPTVTQMRDTVDKLQAGMDWMLGVPNAKAPAPNLRSIRDLYLAITGDYSFQGIFDPDLAQLASATTGTMAGMAVNALNKAVMMHYDNLMTWRWFEPITYVCPHDGSTQPVQLIYVDGVANLPTVSEGGAYDEATVGDSKESMSFSKKGRYVGITLEMIRRSDIARIQAIPRVLTTASLRTRSAAIAGIFTQASGTGPTLADDSTVLFHANHANLGTTAFSAAEWLVCRKRIWAQTVPGTSNKLGLWPTFGLFPIDLYDTALEAWGYGSGDVGKPSTAGTAQTVNPYADSRPGDPRPIPIAVPDWSDVNDFAYIVDPRLQPVIHVAYANQPQGGGHPMPEIYSVTGETNGLIFTNDTLPVKVRDWFAYGVGTYVGVGKNNV